MMMFPLGLSMEVDQIQHSFEKQKLNDMILLNLPPVLNGFVLYTIPSN